MRRWVQLLGMVMIAACGGARPSAPTPADIAAIDVRPDHTITVTEDGYDPARLRVQPGDVIRLVNEGSTPHSFTASDHRFDTRMAPGDDTTLVLSEPGDISYRDVEASTHRGTITVAPVTPG